MSSPIDSSSPDSAAVASCLCLSSAFASAPVAFSKLERKMAASTIVLPNCIVILFDSIIQLEGTDQLLVSQGFI